MNGCCLNASDLSGKGTQKPGGALGGRTGPGGSGQGEHPAVLGVSGQGGQGTAGGQAGQPGVLGSSGHCGQDGCGPGRHSSSSLAMVPGPTSGNCSKPRLYFFLNAITARPVADP